MSSDPLSTLAIATGGAFLGKFVGPAAESLSKVAWERVQQLGTKATALLTAVGREPQPVAPKLLLPLVQAAALETDETLINKWASLLANAADPAQQAQVQPGFAEVLRQLTPMDARILDFVYQQQPNFSIILERPRSVDVAAIITLDISLYEAALSVENIMRLRLGERRVGGFDNSASITPLSTDFDVLPTIYGQHFLLAVSPPTP